MTRQYISCADIAKLVRQALKECFPGVKFTVRSSVYSGGSSIRVGWMDGPNTALVDAVVSTFKGGYFDGMIDYKGTLYHALDGKPVQFGADFIFTDREFSDAAVTHALQAINAQWDTAGTVEQWRRGMLREHPGNNGYDLQSLVWKRLSKFSDRAQVLPSATCRRVSFTGDDGYGAGTVGPYHMGGNHGYVAVG